MTVLVFLLLLFLTGNTGKIHLISKNDVHCLDFMGQPPSDIKSYTYDNNPSPKRVKFEVEVEYNSKDLLDEVNLGITLEAVNFDNKNERASLPVDVRLVRRVNKSSFNLEVWFDVSNHCERTNFTLSVRSCSDSNLHKFEIGNILPTRHLTRNIAENDQVKLFSKTDMLGLHNMKMFNPLREFSCSSPIKIGIGICDSLASGFGIFLCMYNFKPKMMDTTCLALISAMDYKANFDECSVIENLSLYIRFVEKKDKITKTENDIRIKAVYVPRLIPTFTISLANGSYILEDQGLERVQKCYPEAEIPGKVNLTKIDGKFEINASIYCNNPFDAIEINNTKILTVGDLQDIGLEFDSDKREIVLHPAGIFENCRHISLELQCYQEDDKKHSVHQVEFRDLKAPAESFLERSCRITRPRSVYTYIGMGRSELNLANVVAGAIGSFIGVIIFVYMIVYISRCRRAKKTKKDNIHFHHKEQEQHHAVQPQPTAAFTENIQKSFAKQEASNTATKPMKKRQADTINLKEYYTTVALQGKIVRQKNFEKHQK